MNERVQTSLRATKVLHGHQEVPAEGISGCNGVHIAFLLALAVRLIGLIYVQVHGGYLFLDDQGYDHVGWVLAQQWRQGHFVNPHNPYYAGTLNFGYDAYVAAIYTLVGHHPIFVGLANAVAGALIVYPAAMIGERIGGIELGRVSAWALALFPTGVLWASVGLKDAPQATVWLTLIALSLRPISLRRFVIICLCLTALFLTRPALAAAALIVLAGVLIGGTNSVSKGRSSVLRRAALISAVTAVASWTIVVFAVPYKTVLAEQTVGTTTTASYSFSLGAFSVRNVGRELLGPFPWDFGAATQGPYRWMYPGMVVWLCILPAALLGAGRAWRHGNAVVRAVILSLPAYLGVYLLYTFYSGKAYRERFDAEAILLILALYQVRRSPRTSLVVTCVWVSILAVVALNQGGAMSAGRGAIVVSCALIATMLWDRNWRRRSGLTKQGGLASQDSRSR